METYVTKNILVKKASGEDEIFSRDNLLVLYQMQELKIKP